jgi:hypothetical protein
MQLLVAGVPGLPDFRGVELADAVIFIPRIFRESRHGAAFGGTQLHSRSVEDQSVCAAQIVFRLVVMGALAGFEPALTGWLFIHHLYGRPLWTPPQGFQIR